MQLLKDGGLVADRFRRIEDDEALGPGGDVLLPLQRWFDLRGQAKERDGDIGVIIEAGEDWELLIEELSQLSVIELCFADAADGRHYSAAALLRERYAYRQELRASGDVRRDQAFYLRRCGFDAFALADDVDVDDFLLGFEDFSLVYQSAIANDTPVYRLRSNL